MSKDKIIIPMSSSGDCPRALSAKLLSYPGKEKPKWLSTSAKEGTLHERDIKDQLRAEGIWIEENGLCPICNRYGIHVEIDCESFKLVGHMDGRIKYSGNIAPYKLECKSMSQYEFDRWMKNKFEAFPHYADQITCYGVADKNPVTLYVVKNRNNGYIDRNLLLEYPSNFEEIKARLFCVASAVNENKLCEAEYNPDSIWCYRCDYQSLCLPVPKEIEPATIKELTEAINTRWRAKDNIAKLKELVENSETTIKNYLVTSKINKIKFAGWSISLSQGITITAYPKENLIEAGVTQRQLEEAKKVSEPFDRLYMKDLNKEE